MSIDNATIVAVAAGVSAMSAAGALITSLIIHRRVQELHVVVNSRLETLVKLSSQLARTEGQAEGHAQGLAEGLDLSRVPVVQPPVIVVVPAQEEKKD